MKTKTTGEEHRECCKALRAERDKLSLEVAKLRAERDQYLKALYALTQEDFDIDKKSLFAQLGKGQSLDAMIAELESQGQG